LTLPKETKPGWKISTAGLVIGIFLGLVYLAIADGVRLAVGLLSGLASSAGSGFGLSITSDLFDFVNGPFYLVLVVALIVVKIAHSTIKSPLTVRGPLKVALGALTGLFYYFILVGGIITFTIGLRNPA